MHVSKWGNGCLYRLPAAVVEVLALKEGDEIEITAPIAEFARSRVRPLAQNCWSGCALSVDACL